MQLTAFLALISTVYSDSISQNQNNSSLCRLSLICSCMEVSGIFSSTCMLFLYSDRYLKMYGDQNVFSFFIWFADLGAAFTHESVIFFQYNHLIQNLSPENLQVVLNEGTAYFHQGKVFTEPDMQSLQILLNTPTVGASGAIFGVLLAFGVLFPNTQLMLLFPPIPIKAKYLVAGYGALELYLAVTQPGSNIAHAAHLGGMLFGYILIRYWRKTTNTLY